MNLAYHDVRAPPKDYNRLIVMVVLLPSRIRMCVPVLLTFFRASPNDYNRVIVMAHALAQLRTITFLEPSSEGVVCNEHGIVLAVFERGVEHSFAFLCRDQLKAVQSRLSFWLCAFP